MFLSLLQFFATKFLFLALHLESGSFPRPLSPQEEIKTFSALREGDPSAREKLIRHNLRLVAHIAKKYYALPGEQDDLISIGTIGLMKAVDTFDSTRRARFSTYASRCIENAILSPAHFQMEKRIPTLTPTSRTHGTVCVGAAMVLTCCKKRLLPWLAWRNGSIGIWKAAHFTAALRRNLRTSSPPFTASRWRIFWTTTPCFCTGAEEPSSADTGRQKAGTVSSLPTTQRSAGQASAAGKVDKRPSVRSVSGFWPKILGPIFFLCFACEVW